ncbi:MAG TPA: hypothetical protein VGP82_01630 [Ktedonobacterales bacterium]|jgi:heme A synthase|nr:hypothetical protein [Ktedonobacterales bacterium]
MIASNVRGHSAVVAAIRILVVFEVITFLVAASLHLGVRLPLGLNEPRILPAAIVEGLAGLFCAGSAFAVIAQKGWAWYAAVGANVFALFGVLLGMWALTSGYGPSTDLSGFYHRMMLAVLVICIVLLLTPAGRAELDDAPSC